MMITRKKFDEMTDQEMRAFVYDWLDNLTNAVSALKESVAALEGQDGPAAGRRPLG
jgi:hypothetical protein